jgi:uncharacterized protein YwgA
METIKPEPLIGPDLVLLLLAAPTKVRTAHHRINGITRLEKLLFLASQEGEVMKQVEDPFRFQAYDYGPYSKQVYEAVELLEEARLLEEQRVLEGRALDEMEELAAATEEREGIERRFVLTDQGRAVAHLLSERNPEVTKMLATIKDKYAGMPLGRLIRYVYQQYPSYAEKSKIRDQVLKERG